MATTPTVTEVSCTCCARIVHCKLKSLTTCVLWCVSAVRELDVASQCVSSVTTVFASMNAAVTIILSSWKMWHLFEGGYCVLLCSSLSFMLSFHWFTGSTILWHLVVLLWDLHHSAIQPGASPSLSAVSITFSLNAVLNVLFFFTVAVTISSPSCRVFALAGAVSLFLMIMNVIKCGINSRAATILLPSSLSVACIWANKLC